MARRGTEAFPDLGAQCDRVDCNQLDFLPFDCDGCGKTFCAEHRTYRDHGCARAADQGRTVVVCEACGDAIERRPGDGDDAAVLEAHAQSRRCDPARKRKPRCPVPRCKETLTFSNTSGCKGCGQKVCLKHRFPADHGCAGAASKAAGAAAALRSAGQCGRDAQKKEGGGWKLPQSVRNMKIFRIVTPRSRVHAARRGFYRRTVGGQANKVSNTRKTTSAFHLSNDFFI